MVRQHPPPTTGTMFQAQFLQSKGGAHCSHQNSGFREISTLPLRRRIPPRVFAPWPLSKFIRWSVFSCVSRYEAKIVCTYVRTTFTIVVYMYDYFVLVYESPPPPPPPLRFSACVVIFHGVGSLYKLDRPCRAMKRVRTLTNNARTSIGHRRALAAMDTSLPFCCLILLGQRGVLCTPVDEAKCHAEAGMPVADADYACCSFFSVSPLMAPS